MLALRKDWSENYLFIMAPGDRLANIDYRFIADMKLAHYLHIPPRMVFLAQGLATLIGALVQCGVTVYMLTRVHDVCAMNNESGYTCPHGRVTYSASLVWGSFVPSAQAQRSLLRIVLY
jgi:hypothetical protein